MTLVEVEDEERESKSRNKGMTSRRRGYLANERLIAVD